MSIASELTALAANKAAIKGAIEAKNPSVPPTDALSQWPTSIASIGELYDEELDYVTFPVGSYIDPEVEDTGRADYDIDINMRITTAPDGFFYRFGNYRNNNIKDSFLCYPTKSNGNLLFRIAKYDSNLVNNTVQFGSFFTVKTDLNTVTVDGVSASHTWSGIPFRNGVTSAKFLVGAVDDITIGEVSLSNVEWDCAYLSFINTICKRELVPVRKGQVGYLYDKTLKKLYGSATSTALVPGPGKTAS